MEKKFKKYGRKLAGCCNAAMSRLVPDVPRSRCVQRLLCILIPITVLTCVVFWPSLLSTVDHYLECSETFTSLYLDEVCENYTKGLSTGSLCEPLCTTREIHYQQCLRGNGYGMKLLVLQAERNGVTIILKTLRSNVMRHLPKDSTINLTTEQFIKQANTTLLHHEKGDATEVIQNILLECDSHKDGILSYEEAFGCWQLVETEEYVYYSMLRGRSGIPDLYGTCGSLFAVQLATSEPFQAFQTVLYDTRSWSFRARLALALLDMIESIEDTPYGPLYLCDVKEPNFGLLHAPSGKLVAKAIDVDKSWFQPTLTSLLKANGKKTCSEDADCSITTCPVECNTTTSTCSTQMMINNLQSICQRLFVSQGMWQPALLESPPEGIRHRLETLLDECTTSGKRDSHIPKDMIIQLRILLQSSITE